MVLACLSGLGVDWRLTESRDNLRVAGIILMSMNFNVCMYAS